MRVCWYYVNGKNYGCNHRAWARAMADAAALGVPMVRRWANI